MKKLLIILCLLFSLVSSAQIDQRFGAFARNLDSLYNHIGRQLQPITVLGRFSVNDGFAAVYIYDSLSTATEIPYQIIKPAGITTGRWIQVQLLSSGSSDTTALQNPDYAVINILTVPPGSPTTGDKYLAGIGSAGAWIGRDNQIQTWSGSAWTTTVPTVGQLLINGANSHVYKFTAGGWVDITSTLPLYQAGNDYGLIDIIAGNKRNKALHFITNNAVRMRIDSTGRTYIYNTPAGTAGTDSVLVQSAGLIRKISPTYYGTGGGGGGTTNGLTSDSLETYLGTLFNNATLSSTGFTLGANVAVSAGKISFTSTTPTVSNFYSWTADTTLLDRWNINAQNTLNNKQAAYPLIFAGANNCYAKFDATTGANSGKLSIFTLGTLRSTSTAALTFSSGDTILLSFERRQDTLIATATNQTTDAAPLSLVYVSLSYTFAEAGGPQQTGTFFVAGGGITLDSLNISSQAVKNAKLAIVTHSKALYSADNPVGSYAKQLQNNFSSTIILNGPGERSTNMLSRIPEIISLKPKQVILDANTNDLINGLATATWHSNDTAIYGRLTRAGIKVYWLDGIYDTLTAAAGLTIHNYIIATFPDSVIIHTYDNGKATPGSMVSDGLHPSQVGQNVVYQSIIKSMRLKYGINKPQQQYYTGNGPLFVDSLNMTGGITTTLGSVSLGTSITGLTTTPPQVKMGSSYVADSSQTYKLEIFNNGSVRSGITVSASGQEYGTYTGKSHLFYVNGALIGSLGSTLAWRAGITAASVSTSGNITSGTGASGAVTTPPFVDLGGSWSTNTGTNAAMKLKILSAGGNVAGLGFSVTGGLENHTSSYPFSWWVNNVEKFKISSAGLWSINATVGTALQIPQVNSGATAMQWTTQNVINSTYAYVAKTGTYTATATDQTIDCTSGTFTVTLPTAVGITGKTYTIVNSGSGTITIGTTSSQTFVNINATPTTLTLAAVGAAAIVSYNVESNGANWIVTAKVKNE